MPVVSLLGSQQCQRQQAALLSGCRQKDLTDALVMPSSSEDIVFETVFRCSSKYYPAVFASKSQQHKGRPPSFSPRGPN